jgi:hypothetical protein
VRVAQRPAPMGSLVPALVSALGALAVPVMIFPIAGLFCWLVVLMRANGTGLRNILTRFVLPYLGLTALFGLLFYLPVILVSHGIAPLVSNKFVQPLAWNDFIARLGPQLLGSFAELTRDIPPVALLLWPALALVGIVAALRRHQTAVWCLLPALALGAGLVLLVQHSLPYGRTWIYLIPFALLVADSGLAGLLELLPGRLSMAFDTALVAAGLFFAINLMSANIIGRYPDTSAFPDAPLAVEYLKPILQPGDRLRITSTADWPVNYYLWADGIARPDEAQTAGTGRVFFIVKKSRGSIQEMTDRPVVKLLELDDLVLYEFQR